MNHASPINPHHLTVSTDHIIVGACLPVEAAVAALNAVIHQFKSLSLYQSAIKPAKVQKACSVPSYAAWATIHRSSRHASLQFDNHCPHNADDPHCQCPDMPLSRELS